MTFFEFGCKVMPIFLHYMQEKVHKKVHNFVHIPIFSVSSGF